MNVETGTEAAQFPEKEYINVIFLQCDSGRLQGFQIKKKKVNG
jgi:hypothetical protein